VKLKKLFVDHHYEMSLKVSNAIKTNLTNLKQTKVYIIYSWLQSYQINIYMILRAVSSHLDAFFILVQYI